MGKLFAPQRSVWQRGRGTNIRPASSENARLRVRGYEKAAPLVWVWLLSYAVLALLNIWLWEARGIISSELLLLEAQRRLVMDVSPPHLSALIQTSHPLLFYIVLLAGSALNGAALLGATAITLMAWQIRAVGAPRISLPLVVLQPALLVALAQQPSALARAIVLVIALTSLYSYLREEATYQALIGALALGVLILADPQPWPLLGAIACILILARQRPWRQHITVLLIILFPAVCMILSWAYLRLGEGSATIQPTIDLLSVQQRATPANMMLVIAGGIAACVAWLFSAAHLTRKRHNARSGDRTWLALALLLVIPLLDLLSHASMESWLLAATVPLLALPLLALPLRNSAIAQGIIGTMLVLGLLAGWSTLEQSDGEPQQMLIQALGQPSASTLTPYRAVANELNTRLAPGERVLVDNTKLAPLIALIQNSDALLVPQQAEYSLALQTPTRWATFLVVHDDDLLEIELSGYKLLLHQEELSLYQKVQ